MRSKRYVTMMDPFQQRYGNTFTAFLLLPALIGDILWVACILAALGNSHIAPMSLRHILLKLNCYSFVATLCVTCGEIFCVFSRRNNEHNSRTAHCSLHHHLSSRLHHLHRFRGPLLCCLYGCHPAFLHLCQPGQKQGRHRGREEGGEWRDSRNNVPNTCMM